jgi:hypothetical protein
MGNYADKAQKSHQQLAANPYRQVSTRTRSGQGFDDLRPVTALQRKLQERASSGWKSHQLKSVQDKADSGPQVRSLAQLQALTTAPPCDNPPIIQLTRKGKGSKHNRKNRRLAKTMGYHASEFDAPITPGRILDMDRLRWGEPDIEENAPQEEEVDIGKIRREEQWALHEERETRAKENLEEQEEQHAGSIRRREGGREMLMHYRAGLSEIGARMVDIPTPNYTAFSLVKERGGMSNAAMSDRDSFNEWKERYNTAYGQYSVRNEVMMAFRTLAAREYRTMDALEECNQALTELTERVDALETAYQTYLKLAETGSTTYRFVRRGERDIAPQQRADRRLKREYPYGSAKTVPHIHQYHGDFHLKIVVRGSVKRYNIIQEGRRHPQADDALGASTETPVLHALISNILETQV